MAHQTANICVTNATDGEAEIILFHCNFANQAGSPIPGAPKPEQPIESARWSVPAGGTSPYMTVRYDTGFGSWTVADGWAIMLMVKTGTHAGTYWNASSAKHEDGWKECQLQSADAGQNITFTVSTTSFDIALKSGGCTDSMTRVAPRANAAISHVFVLMLENRSFDNMFAMSGINHIHKATTSDFNSYGGKNYYVSKPAPASLSTDPGHEFLDVVEQLTGETSYTTGEPYPAGNNSGFVSNYATSDTEKPYALPASDHWGDVMACFDTQTQAPVLFTLATQFALCDGWFSSMPGPTWPNRFFVHGASSSGLDDSPTQWQIIGWEKTLGFKYVKGSIFDRLKDSGISSAIVYDDNGWGHSGFSDDPDAGSVFGATPQVWSLKGIDAVFSQRFLDFQKALNKPYPYSYTFFEPNYGDVGGTYQGGSSQHPMDDLAGGEAYLAAIFNAIQDSPYWDSSLLIVVYDEHGGFYDSGEMQLADAPNDDPDYGYNTHGFDFRVLGVRVPAVVVSPLIPAGTIGSARYDHSSVPRTLEWLWGLSALTDRDLNAATPAGLLTLSQPRTDKVVLPDPPAPSPSKRAAPNEAERAALRARPMPERGNLVGTLGTLRKVDAELDLANPDLATPRPEIVTVGDAEAYATQVHAKLDTVRARHRAAAQPVEPPSDA